MKQQSIADKLEDSFKSSNLNVKIIHVPHDENLPDFKSMAQKFFSKENPSPDLED